MPSKSLLVLTHAAFEGPGSIAHWASRRNVSFAELALYKNTPFPALEEFSALIVMGGPMSVHDESDYPWLVAEKQFIAQAIAAGKKVLGICLGAQLIAHVMGAEVSKNTYPEIGWFPIRFTEQALARQEFPAELTVIHWHGDTFAIPQGYTLLASSEACQNQGFLSPNGQVLGLQFHMELDRAAMQIFIEQSGDELIQQRYVNTPAQLLRPDAAFLELNNRLDRVLDRFLADIV